MIPIAYAIEECQRVTDPGDIPCMIVSSWKPSAGCASYNLSIFNATGSHFQNVTWGERNPFCNVTFNVTAMGVYHYNSTIEDGIINVEGSKMWILAILLLPLGLCFFFIYLAGNLDEVHNPLKWFFRLLALIMVFTVYQGAHTITAMYPAYADLSNMFSITVYGGVFWTIMAYFLIYIIYRIFMSFKHNRSWDWNKRFVE